MKNNTNLLVFQLANQRFALPLSVVERVVQVVEFCPLPKMPDYIHGVINYHGDLIPVINMHFLFGIPTKEIELPDQLIIAATSTGKLALLVNVTHEVVEIKKDEIVASNKIIYGMRFVHGVIKLNDGMVLINDIDKFLSEEELKQLEKEIKSEKTILETDNPDASIITKKTSN